MLCYNLQRAHVTIYNKKAIRYTSGAEKLAQRPGPGVLGPVLSAVRSGGALCGGGWREEVGACGHSAPTGRQKAVERVREWMSGA